MNDYKTYNSYNGTQITQIELIYADISDLIRHICVIGVLFPDSHNHQ